jgi:hypothetical protein
MNTPKNPEELTAHIEQVVHGYLAEVRRAAEDAVSRAFTSPGAAARKARGAGRSSTKTTSSRRRTADEMAELQDKLEQLVAAQPGVPMTTFAKTLQMTVRELNRPMRLLKQAGRIRTVGERHLTRYFPATNRRSSAA